MSKKLLVIITGLLLVTFLWVIFGTGNIIASVTRVGATNPYPTDNYDEDYPIDLTFTWDDNLVESGWNPGCAPASSYDLYVSVYSDPTTNPIVAVSG